MPAITRATAAPPSSSTTDDAMKYQFFAIAPSIPTSSAPRPRSPAAHAGAVRRAPIASATTPAIQAPIRA